jgi:hypothetical protein
VSQALLYACPSFYSVAMRLLYGSHFRDRYRAVAAEVPAGASVVDVCAGDAYLYRAFLRGRVSSYLALDGSAAMVEGSRRRSVDARLHDLWHDPVPEADVVILQGSLYQFIPHADRIIAQLLAAARLKLVISEPVRNLSGSRHAWLAGLSRRLTDPGDGAYAGARFDERSLLELFRRFPAFAGARPIKGGRDWVGVFHGGAKGACA